MWLSAPAAARSPPSPITAKGAQKNGCAISAGNPLPASASMATCAARSAPATPKTRVLAHSPQHVGHQERRDLIVHRPVRHRQRARAGIEEGARQAREAFACGRAARPARVACRQNDKIGIQLESDHCRCGQQGTGGAGRIRWRRSNDRGLALAAQLGRQQGVGGELQDAVVLQPRLQHCVGGECSAEQFVGTAGTKQCACGFQLLPA